MIDNFINSQHKLSNGLKLLIITQKVDINDDVLGFMHGWIAEFAKHCEKVTVICLQKGEYELSDNVKVLSLGKELRITNYELRITKFLDRAIYTFRFYKYIWEERKNYDKIFVHMNKEYVVLGGLLWRMLGKKIGLWYAHGHAPLSLKIAEKLVDVIFTSTKSGCCLKSKKIKVVGQGIDISRFQISDFRFQKNNNIFRIITVGRISPVKDYETLVNAVEILAEDNIDFQVDIIGDAGLLEQKEYLSNLKNLVKEKRLDNVVNFVGAIPNKDIVSYLKSADIFINMSHTGSLDKAILEAMACGLPILTCNEALNEVLGDYKTILMYKKEDYKQFAEKIKNFINIGNKGRKKIGKDLRSIVTENHSADSLIKKILHIFQYE